MNFWDPNGSKMGVSNSQGRNLGRSVTSARTSGLSSTQGDLGESSKVMCKRRRHNVLETKTKVSARKNTFSLVFQSNSDI